MLGFVLEKDMYIFLGIMICFFDFEKHERDNIIYKQVIIGSEKHQTNN